MIIMELFNKFFKKKDPVQISQTYKFHPSIVTSDNSFKKYSLQNKYKQLANMPEVIGALKIALNYIEGLVETGEYIFKDGKGKILDVASSLTFCCLEDNNTEILKARVAYNLMLFGVTYVYPKVQNRAGICVKFCAADPTEVEKNLDARGYLQGYIIDGKNYSPESVKEIIWSSSGDPILSESIINNFLQSDYKYQAFHKNAGMPSLILEQLPGVEIDSSSLNDFLEVSSKVVGSGNTGAFIQAPAGHKLTPFLPPVQTLSALKDAVRDAEKDIYKAYRIPADVFSDVNAITYDNLRAGQELFKSQVLNKIFIKIKTALQFVADSIGKDVIVEIVEKNEVDLVSLRADLANGSITLNEYRRWTGLEESKEENANKHLVSNAFTLLENVGQASGNRDYNFFEQSLEKKKDEVENVKVKEIQLTRREFLETDGWRDKKTFSPDVIEIEQKRSDIKAMQKDIQRLMNGSLIKHSKKMEREIEGVLTNDLEGVLQRLLDNKSEYLSILSEAGVIKQSLKGDERASLKKEVPAITLFLGKIFRKELKEEIEQVLNENNSALSADVIKNNEFVYQKKLSDEAKKIVAMEVQMVSKNKAPLIANTTLKKLETYLSDSLIEGKSHSEMVNSVYKSFSGDLRNFVSEEGIPLRKGITGAEKIKARAKTIVVTELTKAMDSSTQGYMTKSNIVKSVILTGCTVEEEEWNCNCYQTGPIPPHQIASMERHPNCKGVWVTHELYDYV